MILAQGCQMANNYPQRGSTRDIRAGDRRGGTTSGRANHSSTIQGETSEEYPPCRRVRIFGIPIHAAKE